MIGKEILIVAKKSCQFPARQHLDATMIIMKKILLIFISWLTLFLFLPTVQAIAEEGTLHLSLYPYLAASKLVKNFSPLVSYLSQAIGQPVELELENDYKQHIHHMGNEEVDIAFMGPISYLQMTAEFGTKPILACFEIDGKPTYRGVIAVRKGTPLHDLSSLKGKRFAFGANDSTMGHYVALFMMKQAKIDLASLGSYESIENQENIALGVLMGDFDAGAMREAVFNAYEKEGLQALATSDPIPEHLFVGATHLGMEKALKLAKAMYALKDSEEGKSILAALQKKLTALIPATDLDYQELRTIYHTVEKHE